MKYKGVQKWSWPLQGVLPNDRKMQKRLDRALRENIDYLNQTILGFPGTPPCEAALKAFNSFTAKHPNNIGCHTRHKKAEMGFVGTQELEREYIYHLSSLLGAKNPRREINGHLCSGGTESNLTGLWIARDRLTRIKAGKLAVVSSFLTHYSIYKICNLLGIATGTWKECGQSGCGENRAHIFQPASDGSGLHLLSADAEGQLIPEELDQTIRSLYREGVSKFVVVLNAGTTNLGSVDPIPEVCDVLSFLHKEFKGRIAFHVHVDAAFGGYVLPFTEPNYSFAFQNRLVDTVTVDGHKMGMVPYPAGVFLCRGQLYKEIQQYVGYVAGHVDDTVCGSRPGASAAAAWAAMLAHGKQGYADIVAGCIANTTYLRERLWRIPGTQPFPARMNILAVKFPPEIERALEEKPSDGDQSLREKYCVVTDNFPSDFSDLNSCPVKIFRFVGMPHLKKEGIDEFLMELRVKVNW